MYYIKIKNTFVQAHSWWWVDQSATSGPGWVQVHACWWLVDQPVSPSQAPEVHKQDQVRPMVWKFWSSSEKQAGGKLCEPALSFSTQTCETEGAGPTIPYQRVLRTAATDQSQSPHMEAETSSITSTDPMTNLAGGHRRFLGSHMDTTTELWTSVEFYSFTLLCLIAFLVWLGFILFCVAFCGILKNWSLFLSSIV